MKLNHVHVGIRDLGAAVDWLRRVLELAPTVYENRLAILDFGGFTLILDVMEQDSSATLGFESDDCDRDYARLVAMGALPLDPPRDRPWGVRSAYVAGPGALKLELEQRLPSAP